MIFFVLTSYRHWNRRSKSQTEDTLSGVEHESSRSDLKKVDLPKFVVINTSKGSITWNFTRNVFRRLLMNLLSHISSITKLLCSQKGRLRGILFNRVIKNFVIQGGGDINGHESTEDWTSRGKHYNQLDTSLKHEAFMLGTSKMKHDGGVFDLFITTAPIPNLNEKN
ncbi:hypothetical protein OROMI_010890 [Orobanche minor]